MKPMALMLPNIEMAKNWQRDVCTPSDNKKRIFHYKRIQFMRKPIQLLKHVSSNHWRNRNLSLQFPPKSMGIEINYDKLQIYFKPINFYEFEQCNWQLIILFVSVFFVKKIRKFLKEKKVNKMILKNSSAFLLIANTY